MTRPTDLSAALDKLFSVQPKDFASTRDALVAELRAAGDNESASAVKAQHKPTRAAFALNQVAREWPKELEALFAASRVLASGKSFKAALDRQRTALEALRAKMSGPDVADVVTVLRGAMVDEALAKRVLAGHFSKLPEVELGFFGTPPEGDTSAAANEDEDEDEDDDDDDDEDEDEDEDEDQEAPEPPTKSAASRDAKAERAVAGRDAKAKREAVAREKDAEAKRAHEKAAEAKRAHEKSAEAKRAREEAARERAERERAERERTKRLTAEIVRAEQNLERLTAEADAALKQADRARDAQDKAAETLRKLREQL